MYLGVPFIFLGGGAELPVSPRISTWRYVIDIVMV